MEDFISTRDKIYSSLSSSSLTPPTPYDVDLDFCSSIYKPLFTSHPRPILSEEALNGMKEEVMKHKENPPDVVREGFSTRRLLNPDEPVEIEMEARSSVLLPLPLVVEGKQDAELPTESHVKLAMQMKKLVILASGTSDLGIMSNEMGTMSGDYDLGLEDEDEDDDFGAEEEKKSGDGKSSSDNQLFNFALARMSSLISSSDPLLPSHSCSLMSKYALLLSSAWGVAVAEKTAVKAVESIFPSPTFTVFPAKRSKHTVQAHVGCRKWEKEYFGVGVAVEKKMRITVCFTPGGEKITEVNADDYRIGDCICTFVQGHGLHLTEIQDRLSSDSTFVDTDVDANLTSPPPLPPPSCDPSQGYIIMKLVPFLEADSDSDSDDEAETNQILRNNSTLADFDNENENENENVENTDDNDNNVIENIPDDVSVTSVRSNTSLNSHNTNSSITSVVKTPLSDLIHDLALPPPVDTEKPARGISATLYAWGDNDCNCLGVGMDPLASSSPDVIFTPQSISLGVMTRGLSSAERVSMVSCSSHHTVLCTSLGAVYTCGDGSDGQLGHGEMRSSVTFALVEWFAGIVPPPVVTSVSAGSHMTGSHTAALDSNGVLYTWGKASACGHIGSRQSLSDAASNAFSTMFTTNSGGSGVGDSNGPIVYPKVVSAFKNRPVIKISCGGGFCVAIACEPKRVGQPKSMARTSVYSWGLWVGGRLGLGDPTSKVDSSYLHSKTRKKVARFQPRPKRVVGLDGESVVGVYCGEAHCLAVTAKGEVYAWGQNDAGQCSVTPLHPSVASTAAKRQMEAMSKGEKPPIPPSVWDDVMSPRKVPPFLTGGVFAVSASAGGLHSAVIDSAGKLWTWGGGGHGACLGHGECSDEALAPRGARQIRAHRMNKRMGGGVVGRVGGEGEGLIGAEAAAAAGQDRMDVPIWGVPRYVEGMIGWRAEKVACGEAHTAVVTNTGAMLTFGGGMATIQLKGAGQEEAEHLEGDKRLVDIIEPVCIPREPCTNWLTSMSGKVVSEVACGGQHTMAIAVGERIGLGLGRKLLKACAVTKKMVEEDENSSDEESDEGADDDDEEFDIVSQHSSIFSSKTSLMAQGATADCVLLVGGRSLYCHKVVVSKRCGKLRDLIYDEHRDGDQGITQLILPDLHYDVARCLLQYLYTDDVLSPLDPTTTLPYDLMKAADSYGLKRLSALCKVATAFAKSTLKEEDEGADDDEEEDLFGRDRRNVDPDEEITVPPSTLAIDIGGALGESEYADIKFMANGKPIYAHRCILAARSSYFSSMFRSIELSGGEKNKVVEVEVPDSYVGLLRVLVYVYCGNLAESGVDSLLEDLVAADRYALFDMKRSCESMISCNPLNAASVLDVSSVLSAPRLKAEALSCLSRNLAEAAAPDGGQSIKELCKRCPEDVETLSSMLLQREIHERSKTGGVNPREKLVVEVGMLAGRDVVVSEDVKERAKRGIKRKKEREALAAKSITGLDEVKSPLPLGLTVVLTLCFGAYTYFSTIVVLGPLVPVINGCFMIFLMVKMCSGLR